MISGIKMLILNKDDLEFLTHFPCFWDPLYHVCRLCVNMSVNNLLQMMYSDKQKTMEYEDDIIENSFTRDLLNH